MSRSRLEAGCLPIPLPTASACSRADRRRPHRRARAAAPAAAPKRRIQLRIDDDARELHPIPWELLRDPGDGSRPPVFISRRRRYSLLALPARRLGARAPDPR
jgi:hypothetical protein